MRENLKNMIASFLSLMQIVIGIGVSVVTVQAAARTTDDVFSYDISESRTESTIPEGANQVIEAGSTIITFQFYNL